MTIENITKAARVLCDTYPDRLKTFKIENLSKPNMVGVVFTCGRPFWCATRYLNMIASAFGIPSVQLSMAVEYEPDTKTHELKIITNAINLTE